MLCQGEVKCPTEHTDVCVWSYESVRCFLSSPVARQRHSRTSTLSAPVLQLYEMLSRISPETRTSPQSPVSLYTLIILLILVWKTQRVFRCAIVYACVMQSACMTVSSMVQKNQSHRSKTDTHQQTDTCTLTVSASESGTFRKPHFLSNAGVEDWNKDDRRKKEKRED